MSRAVSRTAYAMIEDCFRHQQGEAPGITTSQGSEASERGPAIGTTDRGIDGAVTTMADHEHRRDDGTAIVPLSCE